MVKETNLLAKIGDAVARMFGNLEKKKEKKLVELTISIFNGEARERDIERFSRRFDIDTKAAASFVYFELMKRGINDLASHDMWVDDGEIIGKRMIYDIDFIRYGLDEFSKKTRRGIADGEKVFQEAESVAQDFDLGGKEVNLARKERKRVEERLKIHNEIQTICGNFQEEIESRTSSSSLPDKLQDFEVKDTRILIYNMEKENKLDPMASSVEAMGHASWAPEHVSDASDPEWRKLEELMEKRRELLGSKAEKLDELVKRLKEMTEYGDKVKRDKDVIREYDFIENLKPYEISDTWKRQRSRR
jgi:hypothetical protein